MKKMMLTLLIVSQAALFGQISVDYSLGAYSGYLWRGFDLGVSPLVTPDVCLEHESGAYLDIWGAFGSGYKEIDLTAAYPYELNEALTLEGGLIYYWSDLDFSASTTELYVNAEHSGLPVGLNLLAAYDLSSSAVYIEPSASKEIPVAGFTLNADAGLGLMAGDAFSGLSHLRLDLGSEFEAGPVMLSPVLTTFFSLSDDINPNAVTVAAGLEISRP